MTKAHDTFKEICERLEIGRDSKILSPEMHNFLFDDVTRPMRPALIAQIAKFTGTSIATWIAMESDDLTEEVKRVNVDHIPVFSTVHLPIRHKGCLFCGSGRISYFRTLNYKECLSCHRTEAHNLREGQEPLLGSSRNVTKG